MAGEQGQKWREGEEKEGAGEEREGKEEGKEVLAAEEKRMIRILKIWQTRVKPAEDGQEGE